MRVFKDIKLLKKFTFEHRKQGHTIGLVPTMGALHPGHSALIETSLKHSDITICTIYVNPVQFNNQTDLDNYPRTLDADLQLLESTGCQAVFIPDNQTIYPSSPKVELNFGSLQNVMEGLHRPGHFNGVGIVIAKLFHIVGPDQAYFGQKDWQQVTIIRQLVADLGFPLKIVVVPIVREQDGLAMSSRNRRLSPTYRRVAPQLYEALKKVKANLKAGHSLDQSREAGIKHLEQFSQIQLEYLEVVQSLNLQAPAAALGEEPLCVCLAAFLGEIRLIDNVMVF